MLTENRVQRAIALRKRREKAKRWVGPVIAPRAVKAFLERPLRSYTWIKNVPKAELIGDSKREDFRFHTDPWEHQVACWTIGITKPQFLFLLDMGGGKSKVVLDILWYRRLCFGKPQRTLILVQSATNFGTWEDLVAEHRPEFKVVVLDGGKGERFDQIERDADIYLLNYDGLMSFVTSMVEGKEGRQINYKMAQDFAALFDALVLDEIHLVGNKTSLRFRMCAQLCKLIELRYGLTGTPFGRNPERLWSQFFLIDGGETLGPTLGLYRAAFFKAKVNYFGGIDYTFDEKKVEVLYRALNNRSLRYEDKEFSDMPKRNYVKHRLTFGVDAEEYYRKVRDEFIQARGNAEEMKNSFLRMRQACAGFLSVKREGDTLPTRVPFVTNPKLEELESIINGLPESEKVIVFHEYVLTGTAITEMLTRKKIKWVRVGGAHSKPALAMRKFLNDKACRILVANNHSGATTGINPQKVCRRIVFYDSPLDPIVRAQAEKRVHRPGQLQHVYIHDLIIGGGVDELILKWIAEGKDLFQAIINGECDVLQMA